MKRTSLKFAVLAAAMFIAFGATAQTKLINPSNEKKGQLHLVSGSFDFLKDNAKAFLAMDCDSLHIVRFDKSFNIIEDEGTIDEYNKRHGEDYVQNWPLIKLLVLDRMSKKARQGNVKLRMEPTDTTDIKYVVILRMGQLDMGHFVALGGIRDGGTILKGLIEVYTRDSDDPVAVIDVNYFNGRNVGYGNNDRMRELGEDLGTALKKCVK